jgi:hypothetical protein
MAKGRQEPAKRSILFRSKKPETKKENTRGLHGLVGLDRLPMSIVICPVPNWSMPVAIGDRIPRFKSELCD